MSSSGKVVLFVDDEPRVTSAIARALRGQPWTILCAQSGSQALQTLNEKHVDVVVTDEVMPEMTGSELLAVINERHPEVIRIILTGQATLEATVRAINEGRIFHYLFKPCSDSELLKVISLALQEKDHLDMRNALILKTGKIASWEWKFDNGFMRCSRNMHSFLELSDDFSFAHMTSLCDAFTKKYAEDLRNALEHAANQGRGFDLEHMIISGSGSVRWISHTVDVLQNQDGRTVRMVGVLKDITRRKRDEAKLRNSLESLSASLRSTVHALGVTTEKRDPYTAGHQERVANLARAIALEMGLNDEQIKGLHAAGLLHDIGKISVPAEILTKPTLLSEFEMAIMKTHSTVGHEILMEIPFPWPVAQIVLQHHERMDGSGYPAGLRGRDILLEARILGVADTVEAMASHRPYRASLGFDQALLEIRENAGRLYDAEVVHACLNISQRLTDIIGDGNKSKSGLKMPAMPAKGSAL